MKEFHITASLRYSGRQSMKISIKAEDQKQAESKFERLDLSDFIDMDDYDIDVEDFTITSEEDAEKVTPRCPHTKEMF